MKTKSLIQLRAIDRQILNYIKSLTPINVFNRVVFPNAKFPQQSLQPYIRKYLDLGLIDSVTRGVYNLTNQGKYFLKVLNKL